MNLKQTSEPRLLLFKLMSLYSQYIFQLAITSLTAGTQNRHGKGHTLTQRYLILFS